MARERTYRGKRFREQFVTFFAHTKSLSVFKNFVVYAGGAVTLRAISFVLVPLYMQQLSPADYGALSLVTSFINIASAVCGLGLRQFLTLEYFHVSGIQQNELIQNIVRVYLLCNVPFFVAAFFGHNQLISYLFLNKVSVLAVAPMLIITFLNFFVELHYQLLQYKQRAMQLTVTQLAVAGITGACTLFLLYCTRLSYTSVLWGQLIGFMPVILVCRQTLPDITEALNLALKKLFSLPKKYLACSLPFIPTMLFGWILASGDRWILARHATMDDVGIYAIADLSTQLFYFLVLYPWSCAYLPYVLKKFAHNSNNLTIFERKNKQIMWWSMCGVGILCAVGLLICKPLVPFILPTQYRTAFDYVWILLAGQIFLLGSYFASCILQFYKQTFFLASALAVPAVVNILFNLFLVPTFGLYGCCYATLLSYVLYFMLCLWYNLYLLRNNQT